MTEMEAFRLWQSLSDGEFRGTAMWLFRAQEWMWARRNGTFPNPPEGSVDARWAEERERLVAKFGDAPFECDEIATDIRNWRAALDARLDANAHRRENVTASS